MRVVFIYLLSFVLVLTIGCKKEEEEKVSILGNWTCEEYSEANQAPSQFYVSIMRSPQVDTTIYPDGLYRIVNFHNLGNEEDACPEFYENEKNELILEHQVLIVGGARIILYEGKGVYVDDYSKISWEYSIDVNGTPIKFEADFY